MIVSWNWLKDYVTVDLPPAEVEQRLMMSGLNHEGTDRVGDDLAIDLEVTSNRPDCLGHLGVAREIGVLFDRSLQMPAANPASSGPPVGDLTQVHVENPQLCYRYTARVIRGVRIGPSPEWLANRLRTIGIGVVNNVVDITNYVLFECGQPLHAFDFTQIAGQEIFVREATSGEEFLAIDHRTYKLEAGMCVIADTARAIALGGVMGGADTEVTAATSDLLIESAEFAPLAVRNTARKLNLHSPSSYRFERRVDSDGVEWASRRCSEMILDLAGGELADGVIDVGPSPAERPTVVLRFAQLARILGIQVPSEAVPKILSALGNELVAQSPESIEVRPPSWRRDLTREIDLIEEVARIHGYDQIPEDVAVPMWPSHQSDSARVLKAIRRVLTAAGFDEAITASLVPPEWSEAFSPWTDAEPITSGMAMKGILADAPKDLGQAAIIRRSLIPSLLEARRYNESVANPSAELFEIAKVYLPRTGQLPDEQWTLGIASSCSYFRLKGVIEDILAALQCEAVLQVESVDIPLLAESQASTLMLATERLGFLGMLHDAAHKTFSLRAATVVAELRIRTFENNATLVPQYHPPSTYPRIGRDLNLIVQESLNWHDLARTVTITAGECLEELSYQETYRDPAKDGTGTKRLLFSFQLRASDRTLTNEEADRIRDLIVAACQQHHKARLVA